MVWSSKSLTTPGAVTGLHHFAQARRTVGVDGQASRIGSVLTLVAEVFGPRVEVVFGVSGGIDQTQEFLDILIAGSQG